MHAGRVFEVLRERLRLPSQLEVEIELVVHSGAVAIAALDTQGRLALVRRRFAGRSASEMKTLSDAAELMLRAAVG